MIPAISSSAIVGAIKWVLNIGGILYFVDLYRKRARIRVSILEEQFYGSTPPAILIEVQNVGLTPSSIEPVIVLKAFLPRPGRSRNERPRLRRLETTFNIDGLDRALPPYVPVQSRAVAKRIDANLASELGFTWFRTYRFKFARGRNRKLRIRSAGGVPLTWWRYVYEPLDFKLRGHVTIPTEERERDVSNSLSK